MRLRFGGRMLSPKLITNRLPLLSKYGV